MIVSDVMTEASVADIPGDTLRVAAADRFPTDHGRGPPRWNPHRT
jgi:hypothetical protein